MALPKLFQRIFFSNNSAPALNADNLNSISKAIDDIDNRLIEVGSDALVIVPQIQHYLEQAEDLVDAITTLSTHPPYIGQNGNWYVWDVQRADYVDSNVDASITVGIEDITMVDYNVAPHVTNTGTQTDPKFHLFIPRAATISSLEKTSTLGRVDTYTMTLQDGSHFSFDVINGEGSGDMRAADYDTNGDVINAGGIASYANVFANAFAPTYMNGYVKKNIVTGLSHSIGAQSTAYPIHVEGASSTVGANAYNAHVEGFQNTIMANGTYAHAEGTQTCAGNNAHAEGNATTATGRYAHAEGHETTASNSSAHAEGYQTRASGTGSHAGGNGTTASGNNSFAQGYMTKAEVHNSMAIGNQGVAKEYEGDSLNNNRLFAIGSPSFLDQNSIANGFVQNSQDTYGDMAQGVNAFSVDENGNTFMRGFPYLAKGVVDNRLIANGDFFTLEDGASYILYTNTRMKNNGAWRGAQAYYIVSPFSPQEKGTGATTTALAVAQHHQFSNIGTAGLTLQKTTEQYTDANGHTAYHAKIGIGSCVANCVVRYALIKVVGSEADFATL